MAVSSETTEELGLSARKALFRARELSILIESMARTLDEFTEHMNEDEKVRKPDDQ